MLANFETYFNMSVWFACFLPDEEHVCHLFFNRSLSALPVTGRKGKPSIASRRSWRNSRTRGGIL